MPNNKEGLILDQLEMTDESHGYISLKKHAFSLVFEDRLAISAPV